MPHHVHPPLSGFADWLVEMALQAALSLGGPTPVFAIAGLQGSGKSTLAAQIAKLGSERGIRVAVLSIDDFYLAREQRARLAREVHPLLATRGPPGTHDLGLAMETLATLRAGGTTRLPRFDKLADDRLPLAQWPKTKPRCDFVLLEGWCLKTPPQTSDELVSPINALERDEDADGSWRRWCNRALANDYPALWRTIDALWFLQGPGFEVVPDWRWQQEQSLQARDPAGTAMARPEVERFVQLFERVSRQALRTLPAIADRTVRLDAERSVRR
jgi:D-glycerate 3-kinase